MNFCNEKRAVAWVDCGYARYFDKTGGIWTEEDAALFKKQFTKNDIKACKRVKDRKYQGCCVIPMKDIILIQSSRMECVKAVWLIKKETKWFFGQTKRVSGIHAWVPKIGIVYSFVRKMKPSRRLLLGGNNRKARVRDEIKSWRLDKVPKIKRTGSYSWTKRRRSSS